MRFLILSTLLSGLALAEPTIPVAREGVTQLAQINARDIFEFGMMKRQNQCAATATLCADGNGCCPTGRACAYTTTGGASYGICRGGCAAGAVTCTTPITACCDLGKVCGADGYCTSGAFGGFTATATRTSAFIGSIYTGTNTPTGSVGSIIGSVSSFSGASAPGATGAGDLASASASLASISSSLASVASSLSRSASSAVAAASSSASRATASATQSASDGKIVEASWIMSLMSGFGMLIGLI